jgi:hypothetical protein
VGHAVPDNLNGDRMLTRLSAEDHIESMRENPLRFQNEVVANLKDTRNRAEHMDLTNLNNLYGSLTVTLPGASRNERARDPGLLRDERAQSPFWPLSTKRAPMEKVFTKSDIVRESCVCQTTLNVGDRLKWG